MQVELGTVEQWRVCVQHAHPGAVLAPAVAGLQQRAKGRRAFEHNDVRLVPARQQECADSRAALEPNDVRSAPRYLILPPAILHIQHYHELDWMIKPNCPAPGRLAVLLVNIVQDFSVIENFNPFTAVKLGARSRSQIGPRYHGRTLGYHVMYHCGTSVAPWLT